MPIMGKAQQGDVDWQTIRKVLLTVRPDWKPINSAAPTSEDEVNTRDYAFCQAILASYPKVLCSHCRTEYFWWNFYRCWDCQAYLCKDCIKDHFGKNYQPHPKLIEQYEAEIATLKLEVDRYRREEDARDEDDSLWS
jgi:hypothetical protein